MQLRKISPFIFIECYVLNICAKLYPDPISLKIKNARCRKHGHFIKGFSVFRDYLEILTETLNKQNKTIVPQHVPYPTVYQLSRSVRPSLGE